MGFLNNNTTTSAEQIIQYKNTAQEAINSLTFIISTLDSQLVAMNGNEDYTSEDITEMEVLLNDLKNQIKAI